MLYYGSDIYHLMKIIKESYENLFKEIPELRELYNQELEYVIASSFSKIFESNNGSSPFRFSSCEGCDNSAMIGLIGCLTTIFTGI